MNFNINRVKISVTIPVNSVSSVRDALFDVGVGIIGNYTNCSLSTKCIGNFKPNDKAHPFISEKNKMQFVEEERLEVFCDVKDVKNVISRLREIHPYEEPVIDIIPLLDEKDFN